MHASIHSIPLFIIKYCIFFELTSASIQEHCYIYKKNRTYSMSRCLSSLIRQRATTSTSNEPLHLWPHQSYQASTTKWATSRSLYISNQRATTSNTNEPLNFVTTVFHYISEQGVTTVYYQWAPHFVPTSLSHCISDQELPQTTVQYCIVYSVPMRQQTQDTSSLSSWSPYFLVLPMSYRISGNIICSALQLFNVYSIK